MKFSFCSQPVRTPQSTHSPSYVINNNIMVNSIVGLSVCVCVCVFVCVIVSLDSIGALYTPKLNFNFLIFKYLPETFSKYT